MYNDAVGKASKDSINLVGNIGGLTLTPGLYKSISSLEISTGNLTFDAKGDKDAIFIIQIASSLTLSAGLHVILSGSAQASNIYWQVANSANFGTTSIFKGVIMAFESITFDTGAKLEGQALAKNGAITMDANTILKN